MQLKIQKRLAAQIEGCSEKRIWLDQERFEDIKEAITKADIKTLIKDGAIKSKPLKNTSKYHARKIALQKRKGRRKGPGSRKGKSTARLSRKDAWINTIRSQRELLKELREKNLITKTIYHKLYRKAKSGFFRNKRHIKLYLQEHNLTKK